MLKSIPRIHPVGRAQAGFSLIEMMVAMTIGLIVTGAAVGLIVAITQANAATVQSTRLTQELRSVTNVIVADLKRARRNDDSIGIIGQGTNANNYVGYDDVTPRWIPPAPAPPPPAPRGTNDCLTFGYDGDVATGNATTKNYRAYRLVTAGGVGSIVLASGPAAANATCASNGTTITSDQINITKLEFARNTPNEMTITVEGELRFRQFADKQQALAATTPKRTVVQSVYIRSNSVR